ncbi:hypothetical protein [Paraburkholderia ribeironis]|nr:hypothetical protein [Paraburkholderia ribeironis]
MSIVLLWAVQVQKRVFQSIDFAAAASGSHIIQRMHWTVRSAMRSLRRR